MLCSFPVEFTKQTMWFSAIFSTAGWFTIAIAQVSPIFHLHTHLMNARFFIFTV